MNQTLTRHTGTTAAARTDRARTDPARPVAARRESARVDSVRRHDDVRRPAGRRPVALRRNDPACGDARRQAPVALRPAPIGWAVALCVGIGLAVVVWAMVIGGSVVADSTAPAVTGTAVVHVRGGESLGDIAARVAPDQSVTSVVATIRELNHMDGSALTAGQPLLAPVYRH